MAENNCDKIDCCQVDILLGDWTGYSLVGGDYPGGSITGNPESSFLVDCPPGLSCESGSYPVVVTFNENEVLWPYPPPKTGGDILLRIPCPTGDIVRVVPADTSQTDINTLLHQMWQECGQAEAENEVWTAYVEKTYANAARTIECASGKKFFSAPGGLMQLQADYTAIVPSGCFTSTESKAAANALADAYGATQVATYLTSGGSCGYWNTEQTVECIDGSEQTVAANQYFSAASQAAADQLAIDAAEAACPQGCFAALDAVTWTVPTLSGVGASGSGDGPYATISLPNDNSACQVQSVLFSTGGSHNCSIHVYGTINVYGRIDVYNGGSLVYTNTTAGAFDTNVPVVMNWASSLCLISGNVSLLPGGGSLSFSALWGPV